MCIPQAKQCRVRPIFFPPRLLHKGQRVHQPLQRCCCCCCCSVTVVCGGCQLILPAQDCISSYTVRTGMLDAAQAESRAWFSEKRSSGGKQKVERTADNRFNNNVLKEFVAHIRRGCEEISSYQRPKNFRSVVYLLDLFTSDLYKSTLCLKQMPSRTPWPPEIWICPYG